MLVLSNALALEVGEYGANVTRENGSRILFLDCYDREGKQSYRMTLGVEVDPDAVRKLIGKPVDIEVSARGRETGTGLKWTALAVRDHAAGQLRAAS